MMTTCTTALRQIQIAEDPHFTAINALTGNGLGLSNTFRINDNIGVHLKYCSSPKGMAREYQFTFTSDQVDQLAKLKAQLGKLFIAMVCVKDRQICCLSVEQLDDLVQRRQTAAGKTEDQYVVLVTLEQGKSVRAYVTVPGRRGGTVGKPLVIPRNCFPSSLSCVAPCRITME